MKNIFLKKLHETNAISVLVLVKTGSRNENQKINGIAHFIEHLMFKGTKKRPNSLSITKELDGIGAEYNAFTSKDKTGYYIRASKEHLELAMNVLSDVIYNSKFDIKEIEKERGVIMEEINMYNDNPIMHIDSLVENIVFENHPLGRLISGTHKTVEKITRADILKFYKKYYTPENMIIGVSGNFDEKKANSLLKKYFKIKDLKGKRDFSKFELKQKTPRVILDEKNTDQIHLSLAFPSVKYDHKYDKSLELLSVILGGNMSSRLFLKIREKLGLCYYIRCESGHYEDAGIFSITSGLDKARIEQAIKHIFEELKNIVKNGVSQRELKMAKEFIKGQFMLKIENSMSVVDFYCEQIIMKEKYKTPEQILKEFDNVSAQDISVIAKSIIKKDKISLALISPYKDKKYFLDLINKYY